MCMRGAPGTIVKRRWRRVFFFFFLNIHTLTMVYIETQETSREKDWSIYVYYIYIVVYDHPFSFSFSPLWMANDRVCCVTECVHRLLFPSVTNSLRLSASQPHFPPNVLLRYVSYVAAPSIGARLKCVSAHLDVHVTARQVPASTNHLFLSFFLPYFFRFSSYFFFFHFQMSERCKKCEQKSGDYMRTFL